MAYLDNIDGRVFPNFGFPLVAHAAMIVYLRFGRKVPEDVIEAIDKIPGNYRPLLDNTLSLVRELNERSSELTTPLSKIISDTAANQTAEAFILAANGNPVENRLRLANAILCVGVEMAGQI